MPTCPPAYINYLGRRYRPLGDSAINKFSTWEVINCVHATVELIKTGFISLLPHSYIGQGQTAVSRIDIYRSVSSLPRKACMWRQQLFLSSKQCSHFYNELIIRLQHCFTCSSGIVLQWLAISFCSKQETCLKYLSRLSNITSVRKRERIIRQHSSSQRACNFFKLNVW